MGGGDRYRPVRDAELDGRAVGATVSTVDDGGGLTDWMRAPNIAGDPSTYELENEAIARDGRLDRALLESAPWHDRVLLDIGCGTGFWLPRYADDAASVIGVEPDPALVELAARRCAGADRIDLRRGSAEHLPVDDGVVDVAHARFAYFFGSGSDAGLREVERVLAPSGVLVVVDNSRSGGDFARLLDAATGGNADDDPGETDRWWSARGAVRHEVEGGWAATSPDELEQILRIEFPGPVVDDFLSTHSGRVADLPVRAVRVASVTARTVDVTASAQPPGLRGTEPDRSGRSGSRARGAGRLRRHGRRPRGRRSPGRPPHAVAGRRAL